MNIKMREYKIIEYSSGDFGDLGPQIGTIMAFDKNNAWERFKEKNKLTDQDKSYYSFI